MAKKLTRKSGQKAKQPEAAVETRTKQAEAAVEATADKPEAVVNSQNNDTIPGADTGSSASDTTSEKNNKQKENVMETKKEAPTEVVLKRKTKETEIMLGLRIQGEGKSDISTGIGFFDHMLEGFAKHGNFDLKIVEKGDLNVDSHHTVEDLGIVLGQAIAKATEDKTGLNRYATFIQPMDDALVLVSVDLCSRTYLNFNHTFDVERVGYFETATVKEFFQAVADNAKMNIHIKVLDGQNAHHIIEATFKGFANALSIACKKNGRQGILSTKGAL